MYAFSGLQNGQLSTVEWNDETNYAKVIGLKKTNPKLKVLLSFGGASFGTQKFKDLAASQQSRQTFINSAISFLRKYGFDGLDVDWEYPGAADKASFVQLLKGKFI